MKPLDPRLVRCARAVRTHLVVAVVCGAGVTLLVLAQAWLLARVIAGAGADVGVAELSGSITALAGVVLARAVLSYGSEAAALRSAAKTKSQLRRRLIAHVTTTRESDGTRSEAGPLRSAERNGPPPAGTETPRAGELATLATRGLDALDDYFARYLPQLVLAAFVPVAVLAVVATADWISAVVIAVTVPLIPVFMALVGWHTQERTRNRWRMLHRLGGHFLDVIEGLPTLAVFRRAKAQAGVIERVTDQHRQATMATLRVAFLSALVLELLSTIAVALVAVEIGLRLMYDRLDYQTALLVLLLAPEAYLPLREVGARFHASMEGVAAAERVFDTLEEPGSAPSAVRPQQRVPAPLPRSTPRLRLDNVKVTYPDRSRPALDGVSLTLEPGERLLLTGPSGAGKSTMLALLLRFVEPTSGTVLADRSDIGDLDPRTWRAWLAWVPQHPYIFDTTVADNIRLGAPWAGQAEVREAARRAEAAPFIEELPHGYDTRVGERGTRLSSGQRQRVALARAFLRDAPIVLLDEPTAHLDPDNAALVRAAAERLLHERSAVVVSHDAGWADSVDTTVRLDGGRIAEEVGV